MNFSLSSQQAASSLIFYTQPNFGGQNAINVSHGETGDIANGSGEWLYRSVAMANMRAFAFSEVNPADSSINYLNHIESLLSANCVDLQTLWPSAQVPLHYLGVDPSLVVPVWLHIDASQQVPNAIAAQFVVGVSTTQISALTLPGRDGMLGLPGRTDGSAVSAYCPFGDYDPSTGQVTWSGNGNIVLEYRGGQINILAYSGFPDGWSFSEPRQNADGSWVVELNATVVPDSLIISSLYADKNSIKNDGIDAATFTATVIDALTQLPASGQTVYWHTTLGSLSSASTVTNTQGQCTNQLTSLTTGTATITASLENGDSRAVNVDINAGEPRLLIRGARTSLRASGQRQTGRLSALDALTLLPVTATWRYRNASTSTAASAFLDVAPEEYLDVSLPSGETVTLNPSNIIGNGEWTDDSTSAGAFAARLNNGSCAGWGVAGWGGYSPSTQVNYGVACPAATFYAFSALRSDGSIFSWGDSNEGGMLPANIAALNSVLELKGARGTFALRSSVPPYIQSWGWGVDTTSAIDMAVPPYIASMYDIKSLFANDNAFVVINNNGQAFAWGDADAGGAISPYAGALYNISDCCASRRAFAVISQGMIEAWGDDDYGGDSSEAAWINNAVRLVATESAFTALLASGGIACWGNPEYGNSLPDTYRYRTDILDVKSTYGAFAALCADGTVISWGNPVYGANSASVAGQLRDIVALSATSGSFAALTRSGQVVTWGDSSTGGNSTAVAGQLTDVCAIYANTHAFAALKADNSVVVWGDPASGVNDFPSTINGNISYLLK